MNSLKSADGGRNPQAFEFTEEYRQSQEYIEWVSAIKQDYPTLPLYLIESAIISHKTDPQYYKKAKDTKEVFKNVPKSGIPARAGRQDKTRIIEDAITVSDAPIEELGTVIEE